MITRNARKRQSGPEIALFSDDSTSCTTSKQVGRKRKTFKIEEPVPALFNIHIHLPLVDDQKLLKSLVQPQIHLHFSNTLGSLGARNPIQALVTNENGNLTKLFSVVTKKSENLVRNVNDSPSKFTRRNSLKKIKLAVSEDVDNEGRVGRKRRKISSVSSTKSFQQSKDDSEMPSLENKLKNLVRGHVRRSLFNSDSKSNDTSSRFDFNENNESSHYLRSKNKDYNSHSLRKAVVLLQDIGCRQTYNLSEFENVTPRTKFRHGSQKDCRFGGIEGFEGKTSTPLSSTVNKKKFFEKVYLKEDMPISTQNLSQKVKKNNDVSLENKRVKTKNSNKNFASQSFDLKDERIHSEQNGEVELKSKDTRGKQNTEVQEKENDSQFNENNSTNLKDVPKHSNQYEKESAIKVCDKIQNWIPEVKKKKVMSENKSKISQSNKQRRECNKENITISLCKEDLKPKDQTWNLKETVSIKSVSQVDDMESNSISVVLSNENPECNLHKQIENEEAKKTVTEETSPVKINLKTDKFASLGFIPERHTEESFQKDKKVLTHRKNKSVQGPNEIPEHLIEITEIEKEKRILVENNSCEKEKSENINESLNESSHHTNEKIYSGVDETCAMEDEILKPSKNKKRSNKSKNNTALNTRKKEMVRSYLNKNEIQETPVNSVVNITLNEKRKKNAKNLICKEKKKKTSSKINKEKKKKCNNESVRQKKQKSNVDETEASTTKQKSKDVKEKFINHLSDTTEDETEEKVPLTLADSAFWSVKRRNGRVYSLVYNSDSDDSPSKVISSLTSLANGCNFSEILNKFKNKNLREKILVSVKNNEQNKSTTEESLGESLNDVISHNDVEFEKNFSTDEGVSKNMGKVCSNSVQKDTPKKDMQKTIGSTKSPEMGTILDSVERALSEDLSVQSQEKEFNDIESFNISDREMGSVQEKQMAPQEVEDSLISTDFLEIQLKALKKEMINKGILKKKKNERKSPKKASRLSVLESSAAVSSSPKKKTSGKIVDDTSESKNDRKKNEIAEDYIPLNVSGPTRFSVVPLNKINPYKKHEAAGLKTKLIFSKNKRYPFSQLRAYKEKQHASQKASGSSNTT